VDLLFRTSTDISDDVLNGQRNIIFYSLSKTKFKVLGICPFFVCELYIDLLFVSYIRIFCVCVCVCELHIDILHKLHTDTLYLSYILIICVCELHIDILFVVRISISYMSYTPISYI
jgi:hypothetical protein